jgi:FtsH-binding integral membrane protein
MLFAPAIGIVSFQVLGGLSWLVTGLCMIGIVRQWISPTATLDMSQLSLIAVVFAVGGFICFWVSRKIRAAVNNK